MIKIPFNMLPWTIGMKGKTRERAKAEYYLEGYDLEITLLNIDYDSENISENEIKEKHKKYLNIQKKYNKISQEDYDYGMLSQFAEDSIDYKKQKLTLDKQYKNLSDKEYEKQLATINNEPWVDIKGEFDPGQGLSGLAIELDWNEQFITQLKNNGYVGISDDNLVQQWFAEICRQAAMDEGILDEIYPVNPLDNIPQVGPKIKQTRSANTTEYS